MPLIHLEPCPCCGKFARLTFENGHSRLGAGWHREQVKCHCGLMTKVFKRPGQASKAWNRRAISGLGAIREGLRVTMLAQNISDTRETYADGFVQGLSYAIGKIDKAASATSTKGQADE
jgi:hypothetical protein